MLDAQHLRSFQEIARTGSYSEAARRLGYTQPALSYQMRLLERSIGVPLTARAGRTVRLTPAGQALLRHADQILTAIRVAERDLAHLVGTRAGRVRLASFASARATLLADALSTVVQEFPAIEVRAEHADPLEATAAVVRGDADLAITYRYAVEDLEGAPAAVRTDGTSSRRRSPLASLALMTDHVHLVLPRSHPLAQSPLSLAGFADERFLVGSELFAGLLERAAGRAGFTPRVMFVPDDHWGMVALAARGVGVALLPGIELLAVDQRELVALPMPDWPARHIAVETWPDLLRLPSITPLVDALRAAATRLVASSPDWLSTPATVSTERATAASAAPGPEGAWARWFAVESITSFRRAGDRAVVVSDRSGTQQVHAGADGDTGDALTEQPGGVALVELSPDGEDLWWFADDRGDERGVWMVQPSTGGPPAPAHPDIPPGFAAGLSVGRRRAVVGRADGDRVEIFVVDRRADTAPSRIFDSAHDAVVGPLSSDDELLAIGHGEGVDGDDALAPAIRVVRLADDGTATLVADLDDGPGLGVWAEAFSPVAGSSELLVTHERGGLARPLLWNPVTGAEREIDPQLPGEVRAAWYPDGSALLLTHEYRGRSELYRFELDGAATTRLPTPRGSITGARARPDGAVEYLWSSSAAPPRLRSTGDPLDPAERVDAPRSAVTELPSPLEDQFVGGSAGNIHVLVARPATPERSSGPQPTVFLVHGGPAAHDADAYSAVRNAWTTLGYVTVQVNYRGSTGYGARWRAGNIGRPGHAELEDLVTIRDALVADGTSDPDRLVIAGRSWGGYLALLALGHHPHLWSLGVAVVPVADPAAVYTDMIGSIRAAYRVRFGGAPEDVPDAYAAASPLAAIGDVDVPLLITAGRRDPRCPIGQIETYVHRLAELGKTHEFHVFDRGHDARSVSERVEEMAAIVEFTSRHLGRS